MAQATATFAVVDSGADTCLLGEEFHIIHQDTMRTVEVLGFNDDRGKETGKHIGSGICAIDLPSHETILLQVNEGVVMHAGKTLLSVNQVRHFGHAVHDCPWRYGGEQAIVTHHGLRLPLSYHNALCKIALRKPTKQELESYVPVELTNPVDWHPELEFDSDADVDHSLAAVNMAFHVSAGEGGSSVQANESSSTPPLTRKQAKQQAQKEARKLRRKQIKQEAKTVKDKARDMEHISKCLGWKPFKVCEKTL